jgi:N-acetylglucosaminyldiphosphoundecaprenol N-acetyl-beta-D-mannosaminyltransferase
MPLPPSIFFCETELTPTSYEELAREFYGPAPQPAAIADFTNTHILILRLTNPAFRSSTASVDRFIPDSMPLTWCVNLAAGRTLMPDRVYGPEFMHRCLKNSPAHTRHYFLGASEDCLAELVTAVEKLNPSLTIAGTHHGYFSDSDWPAILEKIKAAAPDLVWIGLGTPKQQRFSDWAKPRLTQGWLLNVGFAFDVNAGRKSDAPKWMQSMGLTWFYRMLSEPRRLAPRYLRFNTLFLLYSLEWFLTQQWLTGLLRHLRFLALPLLAAILFFATFTLRDLPSNLPLLALQFLNLLGAWTGLMLAMVASDDPEEPFVPSKKLLNLSAFLGTLTALASFLALPLAKITTPTLFLPAAIALPALSWLAPLGLLLTLLTALIFQPKKTAPTA